MAIKKILQTRSVSQKHWVGDGFYVQTMFSYNNVAPNLSPFLLMDYAAPQIFPATTKRHGVGAHPHKGFETITLVYAGEVEHRDSAGNGGVIEPGGVQWMTAGRGIIHEEFHSENYAKRGGNFEMIQLWVNLPKADKVAAPRYQDLHEPQIPNLPLSDGASYIRVIAGTYFDTIGPAKTFTPINIWDVSLKNKALQKFEIPEDWTTVLFLRKGSLIVNDEKQIGDAEMVVFNPKGETIFVEAKDSAEFVILSGEPIDEPVVGRGPFVMNTMEEIDQAFTDFRAGNFGKWEDA